jgi:DNA-binding CsgD family transcriptional regulator
LRDVEVLALVAQGHTNAEIGAALYISEETVKSHLRHIIAKMGARNRTHAVAIAVGFSMPDLTIAAAVAAA